ncbi:autoinducer-2 (AI-2) modifying protein LsrG [Chelonobacter oris]|uniref:Autoinducer-2 (AI-2) modifying protein LsrG n=1 Tax=Chelonobacter oris TaxID=505317 RepID=A0A0A3ANM5_9PAST|nr:(4S)-4-hydroxy-5-phosphonooxypentane-2,3-dione isomerase [Chelonobacter oris]KGQ69377.1 autoinducer-2 (AI-2) modifying protein LsrG [Chelonobacter oris]MDH3001525.1 autoinducer-2 (AI-2) modifying protein LsrG [Chelonobacter oris]
MFAMLVEINIKAGMEAEFLNVFAANHYGTRKEPGNVRFDVLQDPKITTRFYAYEVYENEAALEAHRQTEHYHQCVKDLEPLMTGTRSKTVFNWILPQDVSHEKI